jgi:hypothetical protein
VATPRARIGDVRPAIAAVLGWAIVAFVGPTAAGDPITPLDGGRETVKLIAVAAVASLATLLVLRYRERRGERAAARLPAAGPALAPPGDRIS